jgi:prolipoprotein diacylglyceryl transferase
VLASLPSPDSGSIELGPLTLRAYGIMIALGVIAAVWLAGKRLAERGRNPDHVSGMAMWAVPAGLVGARLYHVITDWRRFEGRWLDAFKIWEGGLGILGGVALGTLGGYWYVRANGLPVRGMLDVVAPALALGQAIGRWGNWFNQELFGKPTGLPWGLEIAPEHRPFEYSAEPTFHPTFLYESLWNLAAVAILVAVGRSGRLRPGRLFAMYAALYAIGRLWIEALRIDQASHVAGLRVNLWVYSVVLVVSLVLVVRGIRRPGDPIDDEWDTPESRADNDGDAGHSDGATFGDELDDVTEPDPDHAG